MTGRNKISGNIKSVIAGRHAEVTRHKCLTQEDCQREAAGLASPLFTYRLE